MKKIDSPSETLRKKMGLNTRYKTLPLKTTFQNLVPQTLQKMAYLLGKAALDRAPSVRKK
jgi:hypothetical protein